MVSKEQITLRGTGKGGIVRRDQLNIKAPD